MAAVSSMEEICRSPEFKGCSLKVINVGSNPELASKRKVLAVPVLIMHSKGGERRVTGDLGNRAGLSVELYRWRMTAL
jgi:hypothetical protein